MTIISLLPYLLYIWTQMCVYLFIEKESQHVIDFLDVNYLNLLLVNRR